MDSLEKLATYGTQDKENQNKDTTQYRLEATLINNVNLKYMYMY